MKRTLLACLLSTLLITSYAATVDNTSTDDNGVPLNKYGAVDVNASIPLDKQVPAAPADFQAPVISPLAAQFPAEIPAQPDLNVKAYLLMDANSGAILASFNGNDRLPPASITKLMLVYIAEQQLATGALKLDDMVSVPEVAWATGGSRMFLKPGMTVSVQDLITGILVDSGNDAAVTLAMHIAGSQNAMVDMMNAQAQQLGMTNTHFSTVMGLPAPNLYSSARDLAVLARAMITQFPQNQPWFARKTFEFNKIKQYNFNKLLFIYSYADGMKTGSTDAAGFSLVSTAKMPEDPMRLIAVVLAAPTNDQNATDSKTLLSYGFRFFQDRLIYASGTTLTKAVIQDGASKTVPVGVTENVYATYPRTSKGKLSASLELNKDLKAPITKGQVLGQVVVKLGDTVVSTTPAVALEANNKGNWLERLVH